MTTTTPRPLPPRPATGGSWRFDEQLWDYVPASAPAATSPSAVPADPVSANPEQPAATAADPDVKGAAEAPLKPQKKDLRK